jgi:hypothetical protein
MMRTDEIDRAVLCQVPNEKEDGIGIVDFVAAGFRPGTVRAALSRLLADGTVQRKWDGNERFGRYLYWAAR